MSNLYIGVQPSGTIEGFRKARLNIFDDDRGSLMVMWANGEFGEILPRYVEFLPQQSQVSFTKMNGVRGYHAEKDCHKLAVVAQGRGFAHLLELRDCERFGHILTVELMKGTVLYIPAGVGNSFECTDDHEELIYIYSVSQKYRPGVIEPAIHPFDPAFVHQWRTLEHEAILGSRDKDTPIVALPENQFHERAKKYGLI